MSESLIVDANPLISALMRGRASDILFSRQFVFFSTQHTLFEVQKYLPRLASRIGMGERDLQQAYLQLPVFACQPVVYESWLPQAESLISARDPQDVPILALAIALGFPLWSDDRDFEGIAEVRVFKTVELLARIQQ